MRLFIAACLDPSTKNSIAEIQRQLRVHFSRANYSRPENLHVTLHFFGEGYDSQLNDISGAIDALSAIPFTLRLHGIGHFSRRSGGDLWWLGIRNPSGLLALHSELSENILGAGLYQSLNQRELRFSPHITIAREVVTSRDFDERAFSEAMREIPCLVDTVGLMKSEYTGGRLVYTPLYSKTLVCGR